MMHVNKVHCVTTIDRVAEDLGEDVELLHELTLGMDTEDGVIWVYGTEGSEVMAFTDDGIENVIQILKDHRAS